MSTIKVNFKRDNNRKWRVRDDNGQNMGSFEVHPGDIVQWHTKDSPMEFRFLEPVDKYFEYGRGLFNDRRNQHIGRQDKLKLKVKGNAPEGVIEYDVEVIDTNELVVGNSRPKLIIRR